MTPEFLYEICILHKTKRDCYCTVDATNDLNEAMAKAKELGEKEGRPTRVLKNWDGFVYRYPEPTPIEDKVKKRR